MSNQPASPTGTELMAKVGSFVLYWSSFEVALTEAVREARVRLHLDPAEIRGGLKERLNVWAALATQLPENAGQSDIAAKVCRQALQLRDARNLIIHGLVGFKAHPELGAAVHIRCAVGGFEVLNGKVVAYAMTDLEDFTQGVDACRRALKSLNYFNYTIYSRPANA